MTREYDAEEVAQKLRSASPDVEGTSAFSVKEDGVQSFMVWTARPLTTDEMISLCRELAIVIRREIPEQPDRWAARILAGNLPAMVMGDYYVGWAGRADEWHLREGQERKATDHSDWLAFRGDLHAAIAPLGIEGKRAGDAGDFVMSDGDDDPLDQTLYINNPEFLTKELIAAVQKLLSARYPDGLVKMFMCFGEPLETLWDGLEVVADDVEERWDRQDAERLLGDRLKI